MTRTPRLVATRRASAICRALAEDDIPLLILPPANTVPLLGNRLCGPIEMHEPSGLGTRFQGRAAMWSQTLMWMTCACENIFHNKLHVTE
mmetsp:Transcript_25802/g.54784  ORF Transcript_25802/g.54784 Transcript_25802/m.54784 type:complete len:90 (+) Transcript_25802:1457-1726(+)